MTKAKGRRRIERGVVDKTENPVAAPEWVRPDLSDCDRDTTFAQLFSGNRVCQVLYFFRGSVVHFALMQQTKLEDGAWAEVVRADCTHEEVHVHYFGVDGFEDREAIRPIRAPADVIEGLDAAERIVYENWEANLQRWERNGRSRN